MPLRPVLAALCLLLSSLGARATIITTYYGDDDGFGVGAFASGTVINPVNSHSDFDVLGTDLRLIGTGYAAPPFLTDEAFTPFSLGGLVVTGAKLTLRMGAFDAGPNPVDGPNRILLDGLEVDPGFLNGFNKAQNFNKVQVRSVDLPTAFFPLFSDGFVSLDGTRISNDFSSGSFQIDMFRLDIEAVAPPPPPPPATVPAPAAAPLLAGALILLAGAAQLSRNR